jgi:hypothetical protein
LVDPKGGATKTEILNAGGEGALTEGDGILVVQVLDPTRSALGAPVPNPSLKSTAPADPHPNPLPQGGRGQKGKPAPPMDMPSREKRQ